MLFCCLISFGQAGFFASGGGVIRLSHNASPDFNTQEWNVNYGSTHSLWLKGGYAHTFKGANGNICSTKLHYRVYKQGDAPGLFNDFNVPFIANSPFTTLADGGAVNGSTLGDQKWENESENIDLTALATSNGTWVLEVYFSAKGSTSNSFGCDEDIFYSNFGNNFKIYFNIVDDFNTYTSAVIISTCADPNFFYRTSGDGVNQISTVDLIPDFGSFFQSSNDLVLNGAELKTFKENYANVCEPILNYRVYLTSDPPTGAFNQISIPFLENCNGCPGTFSLGDPCNGSSTCNDQKWQNINASINLTDLPIGDYDLEFYLEIPGSDSNTSDCLDIKYINNGGNNFKATFTIIAPTSEITSNP
jgi:hypothetical protein